PCPRQQGNRAGNRCPRPRSDARLGHATPARAMMPARISTRTRNPHMLRLIASLAALAALVSVNLMPARASADIMPAGRRPAPVAALMPAGRSAAPVAALMPAGRSAAPARRDLVDSPQVESYILRVRIYTRGDDSHDTVLILDSGLSFKHCAKRALQLG